MANKLNWIVLSEKTSYPLIQLSEVEKCMLAMTNDYEFNRMIKWVEDINNKVNQNAIQKEI